MRLALLGLDETTAAIAHAVFSGSGDAIVLACNVDRDRAKALFPDVTFRLEPWESLLAEGAGLLPCDAVLVGRDDDEERRLEQLRRLVQAGMPLLISHPVHHSMLAYYELDMIRRETGAIRAPARRALYWVFRSGEGPGRRLRR